MFFVSGQYLKNLLTDSIQIRHVVVTGFQGVPNFKVTDLKLSCIKKLY